MWGCSLITIPHKAYANEKYSNCIQKGKKKKKNCPNKCVKIYTPPIKCVM